MSRHDGKQVLCKSMVQACLTTMVAATPLVSTFHRCSKLQCTGANLTLSGHLPRPLLLLQPVLALLSLQQHLLLHSVYY